MSNVERYVPGFAENGLRYLIERAPNEASACRGKCETRLYTGTLRVGESKEAASSGSFMWKHVTCFTAKSLRSMRETYGIEEADYAAVPGWDNLTEEERNMCDVYFASCLAKQSVADAVKAQSDMDQEMKKAFRKRKMERREEPIESIDWQQLLQSGDLEKETQTFLKSLCRVRASVLSRVAPCLRRGHPCGSMLSPRHPEQPHSL
jgi:hypothetical protein